MSVNQSANQSTEIRDIFGTFPQQLADPRLVIVDERGTERPVKDVLELRMNKKVALNTNGKYVVAINLSPQRTLVVNDLVVRGNTRIKYGEINDTHLSNSFAIDLSELSFTNATLTVRAQEPELFKCKEWNFTAQMCYGTWVKIRNLIPGELYTIVLGPDDPGFGEFNSSAREGELVTTAVTPQTALQLNFTPGFSQYLLLGYGELQGTATTSDARARLILNDSLIIGNQSWEPNAVAAPGDYVPFFAQQVLNLTAGMLHNLSVQFHSEAAGTTTRFRQAKAFALGVNNSDAVFVDTGDVFRFASPAGIFHDVANLSFTPTTDQHVLVLVSAELSPNSTTASVSVRLLHNGSDSAGMEREGQDVTDIVFFATHLIVNATANVMQNFTLQVLAESAANKPYRRARITIVPLNGNVFFNATENIASTTSAVPQIKTLLAVNLSSAQDVVIIATADTNISVVGSLYAGAQLSVDGAMVGSMTKSAQDATDDFSFITVHPMTLNAGEHTLQLTFNRTGASGIVSMRRGRITMIPLRTVTGLDTLPPTVHATNLSSTTPFVGDVICLLANVTDDTAVQSVIARVQLPNGSNQTVTLRDDLSCNSIENDSVFSNIMAVELAGSYSWTTIQVTDTLSNTANVTAGQTFEGFTGLPSFIERLPPNLSTYNNGTLINLALINTSNNVYATQSVPSTNNATMYFNWTLNLTGAIDNSNVSIEHSYSSAVGMSANFQILNGTVWQQLCVLNTTTTDRTDVCDLDPFVQSNASVINALQLRVNVTNTAGSARTQNVDTVFLGVQNFSFVLLPSLIDANGTFFDGFEDGINGNWTINGTNNRWNSSTIDPFNGTKHASAQQPGAGNPTSLRINISTQNFTDITLRYARKLIGLDAADEFKALWYNGTGWQVLEETAGASADDAAYVVRNSTLNPSANNNTQFVLEFMCEAGAVTEHCRLDDVRVNGSFIPAFILAIDFPVQNTVYQNKTLDFNYTADQAVNCTYQLNNKPNVTLTDNGNSTFTAREGVNTIQLRCNNSVAMITKTVNFRVGGRLRMIPAAATSKDFDVTGDIMAEDSIFDHMVASETLNVSAWTAVLPSSATNILNVTATCVVSNAQSGAQVTFRAWNGSTLSGHLCNQSVENSARLTCDLVAAGIDAVSEVNNLDLFCVLNDGDGGPPGNMKMDAAFVDVVYDLGLGANFLVDLTSSILSPNVTLGFNVTNASINASLNITIQTGGSIVTSFLITTNGSGFANSSWIVPSNATLGSYSLIINDTTGEEASSTPLAVLNPYTLAGTIKDTESNVIKANITVKNASGNVVYTSNTTYNVSLQYGMEFDINITPTPSMLAPGVTAKPLKEVLIFGVKNAGPSLDPIRVNLNASTSGFVNIVSIDPGLNFKSANISFFVDHQTTSIFKCTNFDFETQECINPCADGDETCTLPTWAFVQNVVPFQLVTITINATDPGFGQFSNGTREGQISTTSAAPVDAFRLNFTTSATQHLIMGFAELQHSLTTTDVRVEMKLNETLIAGNLSWEPDTSQAGGDPPGDYLPFFTHRVMNLNNGNNLQNLTVQFAAEGGSTTFIRRARAFVLPVNNSDAVTNETGETLIGLVPATTLHALANVSFIPTVNQQLLVLASMEQHVNSTTQSITGSLLHNGTEVGYNEREGKDVNDKLLFATHLIVNATAGVSQNFTLRGRAETTANKATSRARLSVVPMNGGVFFGQSEGNSTSTSDTVITNKTELNFNPEAQDVLIIASAEARHSAITNSLFVKIHLFMDNVDISNMTWGLSDATDDGSWFAVTQRSLGAGAHTAKIGFNRIGGSGTATVGRARITVIPLGREVVWNSSFVHTGFISPGESVAINATVIAQGNHTGITVTELAGDGISFIAFTPSILNNLTDDQSQQVQFNCSPGVSQAQGQYTAIYNVNSVQDQIGNNITVNCTVSASGTFLNTNINTTRFPFTTGTFNGTRFNTTKDAVDLNVSITNGSYRSLIFNTTNENTTWNTLRWSSLLCYACDFPDNRVVETGDFARPMNMSNNVLLLHMNETSATNGTLARDSSGNNHHGTIRLVSASQNATTAGKIGGGLVLDGVDDDINFTSALLTNSFGSGYTGGLTAMIWVRPRQLPAATYVTVFDTVGRHLSLFIGLGFYGLGSVTNAYADNQWNVNEWQHVALWTNGVIGRVYRNGKLLSDNLSVGTTYTDPLFISSNPSTGGILFNGTLDEFVIFNRSLTDDEIFDTYQRGVLRLNLSVRSCNDPACSGEGFIQITNLTSPQNLNVSNNSYFQYNFTFSSENISLTTPELYNVSISANVPVTKVDVVSLAPASGATFLINGTVNITANATAQPNLIDSVFANVTFPNGTSIRIQLLNQTRDLFNVTWTNLTQRGRYNITFTANDTVNNLNLTVTNFFVRRAFALVDPVQMGTTDLINISIRFVNNSGVLDINITPRHTIQLVQVFNHSEASLFSIIRFGGAINDSVFPPAGNYSLDVSEFNFSLINVTRTATSGNLLYKCTNFNRTTELCDDRCANGSEGGDCPFQPEGLWVEFLNITPGTNYTFLIRNATDPGFGEFNSSQRDDEINTTSTTAVKAIQANFTVNISQTLLLGYAELQSSSQTIDVNARLILNDTLVEGNQSWQADTSRTSNPPGDYMPFFTHELMNLTTGVLQNLSVEFFSETSAATTFIRRSRAIVLTINNSDAQMNDSGIAFQQLTSAGTFHAVVNLSFRPPVDQRILVLASAEVTPNSSSESVSARLVSNGTVMAFAELEGETPSDIELFAAHHVVNATANITQNFTIEARSESVANKSIRRARITVVPLDTVFANVSEATSETTSSTLQNKTRLFFNLSQPSSVLIFASADVNISSATNGNFLGASLFIDDVPIGNMTVGGSDATDDFSFITIREQSLEVGNHTARLTFRREAGSAGVVAIQRARITVIPLARSTIDSCPVTINGSTNLGRNLTSNDTCITIGASNLELDCRGFRILYNANGGDSENGIFAAGVTNVTIKNCIIRDINTTGSAGVAIQFSNGVNNSHILNNTMQTNGTDLGETISFGTDSNYNRVANNTMNAQGTSFFSIGIDINFGSGNNITNNNISTNGTNSNYGIIAQGNSHNTTITNNTIKTSGSEGSNVGIYLADALGSVIRNNNITTFGSDNDYGIYFNLGTNFTIVDNNTIKAGGNATTSSLNIGIYLLDRPSFNNFTNNNISTNGSSDNYGILLSNLANNNTFLRNTIKTDGETTSMVGIYLSNSSFNNMTENNITTFGIVCCNHGILVALFSDNNSVMNNTVRAGGNGSSTFNLGVAFSDRVRNNLAFGNNVSTNGSSSDYGILVEVLSFNNRVIANTVATGGDGAGSNFGIYVLNASGTNVTLNTVRTFGTDNSYGIVLSTFAQNNSITNNTVRAGGVSALPAGGVNIGIYMTTSVNFNNITGNNVSTNGTNDNYGILLDTNSDSNRFANNTITATGNGSTNIGLFFSGVTDNNATDNVITTNGTFLNDGVRVAFSVNNLVSGNRITANGTNYTNITQNIGIYVQGSVPSTIMRNNITTDGRAGRNYGMLFDGGSNNIVVAFNNITTLGTSENFGMLFTDSATVNTIENNTINTGGNGSNNSGIVMQHGATGNAFAGNRISTSGTIHNHGILLQNASIDNVFLQTNISTSGLGSYGIFIRNVNNTNFTITLLNNTVEWIFAANLTSNNFTNTTFEEPNGSINFPSLIRFNQTPINITHNSSPIRLNISLNLTFLNSTNLSFLNTSAIITLRGLPFSDPKPVVDFQDDLTFIDCVGTICTKLTFSSGEFRFNVTQFTFYSSSETTITTCPVTINGSVTLMQNLTGNASCVTFGVNNIFLDCQNQSVVLYNALGADDSNGIIATGRINITVRNCFIRDINASGAFGIAINITTTNDSLFLNNTIITNGTNHSIGILLRNDAHRNRVANNTINTFGRSIAGVDNMGILINLSSRENNLTNNTITTNGSSSGNNGILLDNFANNTLVADNIIVTSNRSADNRGIEIFNSSFNTIRSNRINTTGTTSSVGLRVMNSSNNTFVNNTIVTGGMTDFPIGIAINDDAAGNIVDNNSIRTGNASNAIGISIFQAASFNSFTGNTIIANGTATSAGIAANAFTSSIGTRFVNNNITTLTPASYGIVVDSSNNTIFRDNILDNPTLWISHGANVNTNFTNTTFNMPNGSINFTSTFQMNTSRDIDKLKLNITFNNSFVNTTNLTFLNITAIVELRNLTNFIDPIVVVDFNDTGIFQNCSPTICTELSFSAVTGIFRFNVTRWTSYAAQENVTNVTGQADLIVNASDILFSDTNPRERQNISMNATVCNNGTATASNFNVTFADGNETTGIIFTNLTGFTLSAGVCMVVNTTYITVIGNRTIAVLADAGNIVSESNEGNNLGIRQLNVQAHTFYFGQILGNLTLDNTANLSQFTWNFSDAGFVYFFDNDSSFNFSQLQAIGRNTTNGSATNDFGDVNLNLNMSGFNDSIQFIWSVDNTTAEETRNLSIFSRLVNLVPVINSTNASTFITGMLWDTNDDASANGQYDTTDDEDLVFVGNINLSRSAQFSNNTDYDMRVPSLLRAYKGSFNQTAFIVELT